MPDFRPALLLIRPRAQSERFAETCRDRFGPDLRIVISPLLAIRDRAFAGTLPEGVAIVATSANAIKALARSVDLSGRTAHCVGEATAQAASAAGMRAVSAGGDAADLLDHLRARAARGALFFPRGAEVRVDLEPALREAGFSVSSAVLYDQVPTPPTGEALALVRGGAPVVLPLFSPRSAVLAAKALSGGRAPLHLVALSRAVAAAWDGPDPASLSIAARPDADAILQAIAKHYLGASS